MFLVVLLATSACGADVTTSASLSEATPPTERSNPTRFDSTGSNPTDFDPTDVDEQLPPRYRQFLPHDAIAPIYEPTFTEGTAND